MSEFLIYISDFQQETDDTLNKNLLAWVELTEKWFVEEISSDVFDVSEKKSGWRL